MTVQELINELEKLPACVEVSVDYDGYYSAEITIAPYVNKYGGVTIAEVTDETLC